MIATDFPPRTGCVDIKFNRVNAAQLPLGIDNDHDGVVIVASVKHINVNILSTLTLLSKDIFIDEIFIDEIDNNDLTKIIFGEKLPSIVKLFLAIKIFDDIYKK